ncbi:MAG TPA: phosphoribosyltransferase family protein, partial [Bdellovibrio sp.]
MTKAELAKKIYDIAHLTGEFKLRSGQVSHEYFDKYRFEAQPTLLREIAKQMAPLIPVGTEILAGLEMGGIPVATALSLETGIPCVFVRKKAKDYGTCKFAEGLEIKGKKVCIIEDVVTTGGQVVLSTADLRSLG